MNPERFRYPKHYNNFERGLSISSISDGSSITIPGRGASSISSQPNKSGNYSPRRNPRYNQRPYNRENRDQRQHQSRGGLHSTPLPKMPQYADGESKYYICPKCKYPYSYFRNNNVLSGRIPRVLPCEHTMCEDCINKSIKTTNQVRCVVCSTSTNTKNLNMVNYNHYIMGQITCSKMKAPLSVNLVPMVDTKLQPCPSKISFNDTEEKCGFGGCSNQGRVSCLDCCGVYCNKCDEALHSSGKSLRSHKRKFIEKVCFELEKCVEHPTMLEELYCNDCEKNCCCYCILDKHEGHTRSYLSNLNKEDEAELMQLYTTATENLKQLQVTQSKVKKPLIDRVSNIEFEIAQQFSDVHAKLYLLEKKLREEAAKMTNNPSNMSEFNRTISVNIDTLKYVTHCIDMRKEMKLNLRGILQKLKEIENLPTFLITNSGAELDAKLVVDDRINELEDYFKLVAPDTESYELVTANELPENYVHEEVSLPVENEESYLRFQPSDVHYGTKSKKEKRRRHEEMCSFERATVFVTHIQSLDSFYIQFKEDDDQFKDLEREIKWHVDKSTLGVRTVELSELYMAPCLFDKSKDKWGRVRIIEEMKSEDNFAYKVQFIDFGNCLKFRKNQLKYISSSLAQRIPFAIHCKLDNPSGIEWSKDAHIQLATLLNFNKEVLMYVKEFSNNIYTVDLNINTSLGGTHSVIDLMIFGSDAIEASCKEFPFVLKSDKSFQLFENSDIFTKGDSYEIFIRYVLDPFNIYVQKASYEPSTLSLMKSMEQFYKHSQPDIHLPVKDSDVVIFYQSKDRGNWHRARIQEVFNSKKVVNVLLVDWGKRISIGWKNLRRLVEFFKSSECLVVCVKLSHVTPKSGDEWSYLDGAKEFLEKYATNSKRMKMLVSEADPLEIVLFEIKSTYDENINALLVENDFALSSGQLSRTLQWPQKKKEEEKLDENEFLPVYKDASEDDTSDEEDCIRTKVEIVRFEDPYSIYVSFVSRQIEADQLREELQIHYREEFDVQDSWNLRDKVVVFNRRVKQYFRGRIDKLVDNKYYVYLVDLAEYIWVLQEDLRSISPYFSKKFPNMVLRCNLADIKPAGDTNKWSRMSLEWFQMLFKKHKDIYIRKIKDDKLKLSLPVTMWYSKVIQGGALEPSIYKYFSIDKKVVKAGLAFRISKEEDFVSGESLITSKISKRKISLSGTATSIEESRDSIRSCEVDIQSKDRMVNEEEMMVDAEEPSNGVDEEEPSNGVDEEEASNCPVSQWLPPISINRREFYAYVKCAETEGYLFIRDEEIEPHYKEMELNMKLKFDTMPRAKPFDLHENQMVTIWNDPYWYRGMVLSVIDKKKAKVMMIDFGSDHIVKLKNLHSRIMYPDVPILVTKIKLYDIHSKTGKWSPSDVDTLLDIIPEYSKIVIRSSLNIEMPLADLYDVDGVCVNDKLVALCPNLYRSLPKDQSKLTASDANLENSTDEREANVTDENQIYQTSSAKFTAWSLLMAETEVENENVTNDFTYVNLPIIQPGKTLKMVITAIYDYKTVSIYAGDDHSKEEDFEALSRCIQKEAPNLKSLPNFVVGTPCISIYQEDKQWYRAKIVQLEALDYGFVFVFYVDYGNFEIVKDSDIKPIKPEWLNFPAKYFVATINLSVVDAKQESYFYQHMLKLVGKSKYVEFVGECPLRIHIYDEEHDGLYYDMFVKKNVIKLL